MTTSISHSPAPWRVEPTSREYRLQIVDADGCQVAVLDSSKEAWGGMDDDQFLQGDAALMATVPDLFKACDKVAAVSLFEPSNPTDALIAYRRAAVGAQEALAAARKAVVT